MLGRIITSWDAPGRIHINAYIVILGQKPKTNLKPGRSEVLIV